jgi:3-phosphoshikimate 1-carboxyvinyltransferase
MQITVPTTRRLIGELCIPGDKSITHRALIFAALCDGECEITAASPAQDCAATIRCLQSVGLQIITNDSATTYVKSAGVQSLRSPQHILDVENSGTAMRLLTGLLCGTSISCVIDGDQSIRQRPVNRVFEPLGLMGAKFACLEEADHAPFKIEGTQLHAANYSSPVASAQVETAFILAALQAEGKSTISMPAAVRDHSTRLLQHMGVPVEIKEKSITVQKLDKPVAPYKITIPGDLSSAAFFMVAAALLPGSDITLHDVGINPGRRLVIDAMQEMGADITLENQRNYAYEPMADVYVKYSPKLQGITVSGARVALGIDEIPILALLSCFCEGTFCVQDASELRYKESNRLQGIVENLREAGAAVKQQKDGFEIAGNPNGLLGGSNWATHADHRLAMTGIIAGLASKEPVRVDNTACIKTSYPSFEKDLEKLLH